MATSMIAATIAASPDFPTSSCVPAAYPAPKCEDAGQRRPAYKPLCRRGGLHRASATLGLILIRAIRRFVSFVMLLSSSA